MPPQIEIGRKRPALFLALAAWCSLAIVASSAAARPSDEEERGKRLYLTGTSAAGRPVEAIVGEGGVRVPASSLPCAGCHGRDGRGKPEAGMVPLNITWGELTKPYGHAHAGGRRHAPYTEAALALTVRGAVDPAGHRLSSAKPRYLIGDADMADLIAYLKVIGSDLDPGLTATSIVVGTILPSVGPLAEPAEAVRQTVQAYFEEINSRGGIYGRRIELRVTDGEKLRTAAPAELRARLASDQVFGLLAPFVAGIEQPVAAAVEEAAIPVLGPFTLFPSPSRLAFHVLPDAASLARVLVVFTARRSGLAEAHLAVIHPEQSWLEATVESAEKEARAAGWEVASRVAYSPGRLEPAIVVAGLRQKGVNVLLILGSGREVRSLVEEAVRIDWRPHVLAPGPLLGGAVPAVPPALRERVHLAYPTAPALLSPAGASEYRAMAARHRLGWRYPAQQVTAYAAARTLAEGLKLAGQELTREKLVAALEGLREFDAGVPPLLSFGPNRRFGVTGAWVYTVDPDTRDPGRSGEWVSLP